MAKRKTKAAAEAEAAPPAKRGPGRVSADGVNRSAFIRDLLTGNPRISSKDVQQAWTEAGNTGKLNITTFYMLRSKLLPKRAKRVAKAAPPPAAAAPGRKPKSAAPSALSSATGYAGIEESLDTLIHAAMQVNDSGLADALRIARRHASVRMM